MPGRSGGEVEVQVQVLQTEDLIDSIQVSGSLRAEESVDLQMEMAGKVREVNFTEGTDVRRGDLLLQLDDSELAAAQRRAEARRDLARLRERRLAALVPQGSVNLQDYDTAAGELAVQEAEVALIAAQRARTTLRAPFDGRIGLRLVSPGAFLSSTTRIATLQGLGRLKLDFAVPERHANRVPVGARVHFTIAGGPATREAVVTALEPRVDEASRTLLVRAQVDQPEAELRPGALALVTIELERRSDALLLPALAVVLGEQGRVVFVVEQDRARERRIETGRRSEDRVEVLAGLAPGETVIVSGVQAVREGSRVRVRDGRGSRPGRS